MKDILICIDMQNDFIDGSLGTSEAASIVNNVRDKIIEYDSAGTILSDEDKLGYSRIYFTRDTHISESSDYSSYFIPAYWNSLEGYHLPIKHCIYGTDGWEIRKSLTNAVTHNPLCIYNKYGFGFPDWNSSMLDKSLNAVKDRYKRNPEIEICGLCTDICVISNALILKALYREFEIYVDPNCCAGSTPENHEAAIKVMRSNHICIIES